MKGSSLATDILKNEPGDHKCTSFNFNQFKSTLIRSSRFNMIKVARNRSTRILSFIKWDKTM